MQEYQAIEQEVQELELAERFQVLPQVLPIAHDFLDQDSQVSPVQTKRSSSRVLLQLAQQPKNIFLQLLRLQVSKIDDEQVMIYMETSVDNASIKVMGLVFCEYLLCSFLNI